MGVWIDPPVWPTPLGAMTVDVVGSERPARIGEVFAHAELTASPGAWGVRVSLGLRSRRRAAPALAAADRLRVAPAFAVGPAGLG